MIHVTVREHARLTTASIPPSLDSHTISPSAFEYLCAFASRFSKGGAKLVQLESMIALRLDNYVGVIETPCGTVLEILPKHVDDHLTDVPAARKLLIKMLGVVLNLRKRESGEADIEILQRPLTEWIMRHFLLLLDQLVKRGVRFDYLRVEEEGRYLRGQLNVAKQVLQPAGRRHLFHIRHDVFSPDRAENRLLRAALVRVCTHTQDPRNWRLSRELATMLSDIPASSDIDADFYEWRPSQIMAHYNTIKPWCELILGTHMPIAQKGEKRGISLLFPMETLFEAYVAQRLQLLLPTDTKMTRNARTRFLCDHNGGHIFRLEPDMLVARGACHWVLDAKWKMIDALARADKYYLDQGDMYQMLGYGHRYVKGEGELFLIYPRTRRFSIELPVFHYSDSLRLRVIPFDLELDTFGETKLGFLVDQFPG